ncbi:hypothetical protein F5883DRAFT_586044 [Diaporthe sp. PMI_573]|nr:hypothetical protein F5883DRAFT_586044 [Diaporthaceae sp. PMI_573]
MHPEAITGWLKDLHASSHYCADTVGCPLPAWSEPLPNYHSIAESLHSASQRYLKRRRILGELDLNQRASSMASSKKNLGKTTDIVTEADNPPQLGPVRADDDTFWQGSADIGPRRRRSPRKHSTQAPTFVDPGRNAAVFSGNDHGTEDDRDLGDDHRTPRAVRTHAHNPRQSAELRPSSYTLGLQKGMQSAHKLYSVRSKSTTSSQSRSSSPVKRALDLQMLSKPVYWSHSTDFKEIQTSLKAFPDVLGIFNEARRIAGHGLQYLPMELKPELQDILAIDPDLDICFASERPVARLTRASRYRAAMIHRAVSPMPPTESQLQQIAHMDYLATEMQTLHELADLTNEFKTVPRSEAAWNSGIHEPILRLAVKSCQREDQDEDHGLPCCAEVENITRANIAKPFLPTADHTIVTSTASLPSSSSSSSARSVEMSSTGVGHLQATTGTNARETELQITAGKMIDFAIVLRPPPPATMSGSGDSLIRSLYHFVKSLPEGTNFFNQCTYEPLIFSPSGVFIETKIDSRQYAEAQNQLGIWLASWFGRIRAIREYISESRQDQGLTRTPCIPVLLVVADAWQLWFAVDGERQIDVLGPVNCGGTSTLDDAYRLFAVLRRLVKWVGNGGFRAWVEEMVSLY